MVDVPIGQQNGADRGTAKAGLRMKRGCREDLLADVRRAIDKEPILTIDTDCNGRLGAGLNVVVAVPESLTYRPTAIPLGIAATGCRSED